MTTTAFSVVILAAGKGTRMKSDLPKVLHKIGGKAILAHLLDTVQAFEPAKTVIVTAPDQDNIRTSFPDCDFAIQEKQKGTGDAVAAALPQLEGFQGNVLILMGDEPFIPENVLQEMAVHSRPVAMAILPDDPAGLGRMVMDEDGSLVRIVEEKDCSSDEAQIPVCNAGNMCLDADDLRSWLPRLNTENAQGEYYLTDLADIARTEGKAFDVFTLPVDHVWGINDKSQLAAHEAIYQDMLREKFMREGVHLLDPGSVFFHHDTDIAPGVLIEPNVFFGPGVRVSENVHIKGFSHIEGANIGAGSTVGPFARLRPGSEIGKNVRLGNFVEVKKSAIGDGSKVSHLSYIGDSTLGRDVNFGCGAITVNYDGFEKFETHIGDAVMIGSNVNLIAPVSIGSGAFIAAGSTITKDVPDDALSLSRAYETNKPGWASNFREKKSGKKKEA